MVTLDIKGHVHALSINEKNSSAILPLADRGRGGSNYLEMVCRQGERGSNYLEMVCRQGERGVEYLENFDDVIYGRPLTYIRYSGPYNRSRDSWIVAFTSV